MQILDGKLVAQARRRELQAQIAEFKKQVGRAPGLAVLIVGENPASQVYVRNKVKSCADVGIESWHLERPATLTQAELHAEIDRLNADPKVDGILVQLPLPKTLDETAALERIDPRKDPDGLTSGNLGLLFAGRRRVAPCTPWGVMKILEHYGVETAGRRAVVVGRSNIVGKPMAQLLLEANATVTIAHSRTRDLRAELRRAEIAVIAAGQPRFVGGEDFSPDAVVIDVGIHRLGGEDGKAKLCGDVRFEGLKVRAATPVPGGVGPMTIQMLLENTLVLARLRGH
ncbi:MAG TPA: bifunctional methylenetetrahydrofolate dehydrogenase/methenyltetrahydrofolate cyclohydrolase FolD [Pseudobdellovibrionaceae bacterium]|nr:bifunctional methylenetetrahydrofolate dehydrogenase/methenyltetrahydrofolate cyclohydrolase FolD [Pseudobdellovibrionaceae bacterium]